MNLLAPAGLALAVVAVPIVAMYILKMRRPPRTVPSTFLWEPVLRDMQANAPWQRLRPNLLLLLQLLAVAVLVVALARPYVLRAAATPGDVVAVLDASALMSATDVAPNRFDAARARIGSLIDGLGPNAAMSIVLMARHPRVLIAQSADRTALHAALDGAAPTLETPDVAAALDVAGALARGAHHPAIYLYTAAGAPAASGGAAAPVRPTTIVIGGALRDLAITALAAAPSADGTVTVLARVGNLGRRPASSDLQLDAATGRPGALIWHDQVDLRPLSLSPGGSTVIVRGELPAGTVAVRAHLLAADNLAADKWAWAVVPVPARRRVLLVSPGGGFSALALALSLAPGVTVDTVTPNRYSPARARGADLIVFDTWLPAALPRTAVLAVGPPSGARSLLGLAVGKAQAAAGLDPGDDPFGIVCAGCTSQVTLSQATPLGVPPWAYALLTSRGQAVLVAGQNGARREAVLGFALYNTDWGFMPGFPIVVQNLLDWLAPPFSAPAGQFRPGDAVALNAPPGATALSVVDPAGHRLAAAPPFPVAPFVQTDLTGLYTVEAGGGAGARALFAVNLLPQQQPPAASRTGARASGAAAPTTGKTKVPVELAPYVAALALLVLAGEWWLAARWR